MQKIIVDEAICKGCSLCIAVCKPGALRDGKRRNKGGHVVPDYEDAGCIQCANCEWTCPEMAITVTAKVKRKDNAQ